VSRRDGATAVQRGIQMGILDFITKKHAAAPALAGASATSAATPEALKAEISKLGLDVSKVDIAVDGTKVTLAGSVATTADSEKISLFIGNTQGVSQVINNLVVASAHAASQFYTVKEGDNLWKIAEAVYGKGHGAKNTVIFEANRPMLSNPDRIYPGQVLRIPDATQPVASAGSAQVAAGDDNKGDEVVWKSPTT
jgi:nucleoid-associated protein YgaU